MLDVLIMQVEYGNCKKYSLDWEIEFNQKKYFSTKIILMFKNHIKIKNIIYFR